VPFQTDDCKLFSKHYTGWIAKQFSRGGVIINIIAIAQKKYTKLDGAVGGGPARLAIFHRSLLVRAAYAVKWRSGGSIK
jgi:hypothetical protein